MTLSIVAAYLGLVLTIGVASHRLFAGTGEDYFAANRSIGPVVLLMTLFGTHMTAFSLLGASAEAYRTGIGVFSLMASSSALVVPAVFLLIGTRVWALGRRHGYLTQVQLFRDRWGSDLLGLMVFAVLVALLIPYLLIGVMGAGITLREISGGQVPQWLGSLALCLVVLLYVCLGGARGTSWANTFQTTVFVTLGVLTFALVLRGNGGLGALYARVDPELLMHGARVPGARLLSYTLIPLSVATFPHIFLHWLTARRAESFRLTVVAYPILVALVWLPSVSLGLLGTADLPGLTGPEVSSVLVRMIGLYAPDAMAGLLGAGVFAAVMSSLDSQVLSLSTLFTQDVVRHYGFGDRMSDRDQVLAGRLFVAGILALTFLLSLVATPSLFRLGIWSFTGYASLTPLVVAALFWRRSTWQGAAAAVATTAALWLFFFFGEGDPFAVGGTAVMPVVVMLAASSLALVGVSLLTPAPEAQRLARFFPVPPGQRTEAVR